MMKLARPYCCALAALFASCGNPNLSALDPRGPLAGGVEQLWWLTFWVCTLVFVLVLFALGRGLRRAPTEAIPAHKISQGDHHRLFRRVALATGVTVVILFGFLMADLLTGRALATGIQHQNALTVEIIGHQWWWEIRYQDSVASNRISTANELHIPVGQPVRLRLQSRDVIHSFWVPSLNGKKDLTPGYLSELWLQADSAGVFEGQCAEFCGHQHAHMRLLVIAQPVNEFVQWWERQKTSGLGPADATQQRGQQVFMNNGCVLCHNIGGTDAFARMGPDLTHIGSRRTLAAGRLLNTPDNLARWIQDPQRWKPGSKMPPTPLTPDDLAALTQYLGHLR
jgi:cytochrome c oxidase subunit II